MHEDDPRPQYLRPHGKTRQQYTDVFDEGGAKFEAIASSNYSPEEMILLGHQLRLKEASNL